MRVTICGPNLMDQSKGSFHIHAAGCADLRRGARREPEYENGWTIEANTKRTVVMAVYADQIGEGSTYEACREDLHFMDCCAALPETEEQ